MVTQTVPHPPDFPHTNLTSTSGWQTPLLFWTVGMGINIAWMLVSIRFLGVIHKRTSFYLTAKAFIIAELVAAITWHLYCLTIYHQPVDNLWTQGLFLLIISLLSYWLIYLQDKKFA